MRGRKSTEIEVLDKALAAVEDPYRIRDLATVPIEELAAQIDKRVRYTTVEMVNQGRLFMAIKERLDHGEWEPFVIKRKWSMAYVRGCMKMLEIVAKFPAVLHLAPGTVTNRLLNMSAPKVDELLGDASEDTVKNLTPWDLEKIYLDERAKAGKGKPRKQYDAVAEPESVDDLVMTALGALNQIAELDLTKSAKKKLRESLLQIEGAWNRASYNLRDPEHKTVPPWEMNPMADDVSE